MRDDDTRGKGSDLTRQRRALRVLLLEDDCDDAFLIEEFLGDAGFEPEITRVQTEAGLLANLSGPFDVILADYHLPGFDGAQALKLAREQRSDVPFLVVSGTVGEETAVAMMREGAADYLLKDRLTRLGAAVERAMSAREAGRRQAEAATRLDESERRFRSIVENASDLVVVASEDGSILYQSPSVSTVLAYEPGELVGRKVATLTHPDDLVEVSDKLFDLLKRSGSVRQFECRFRHRDGTWLVFDSSATSSLDRSGALQLTIISRDVTERHRMETQLRDALEKSRESDRLKSVFLTNIGHEVRTPLNIMLGYTSLLIEQLHEQGDESLDQLLAAVDAAGRRLLTTMVGILDMARIQTGTLELYPRLFDVVPLLERIVAGIPDRKGLTLELSAPGEAFVHVDEYCFEQAVRHLIANAVKFTPAGRVDVVVSRNADRSVDIEMRDTGIGIDESYLAQIFRPFTQESSGATRRFDGSGLGLALTKRLLELNGAGLSVQTRKGAGSTFRIHCPPPPAALDIGPARRAPAVGSEARPVEDLRPRVLIVEDDVTLQEYMIAVLQGRFRVAVAATAERARQQMVRYRDELDLVLMDIALDGPEDGLALTRWIRSEPNWASLPIIAVTVHASPQDREAAIAAGCDEYLVKPFYCDELLAIMDHRLPPREAPRPLAAAQGT